LTEFKSSDYLAMNRQATIKDPSGIAKERIRAFGPAPAEQKQ
jgi:hypothetical protein